MVKPTLCGAKGAPFSCKSGPIRHRFLSLGLACFALALPHAVFAGKANEATETIVPLSLVHPQLRPALLEYLRRGGPTGYDDASLNRVREVLRSRPMKKWLATPTVRQVAIAGEHRAPDVKVYVINEQAGRPLRPGVLFIHGGGYIFGSAAQNVRDLQELALELDCVVVSVDYRLAPETRFPGQLEDNYGALRWLHQNAVSLGVDRARVGLLGESAGGGHASALAFAARDRGEVPIKFQLLIYPMLDDRTGSSRPVPRHMGAFAWTAEKNRYGWTSLLGVPAGSRAVPKGSVPAREANLAGLPPTFIGVGSIDLFADENILFARRLAAAGVPVELVVVPGAYHGFFSLSPDAAVSKRFKAAYITALREGLQPEDAQP